MCVPVLVFSGSLLLGSFLASHGQFGWAGAGMVLLATTGLFFAFLWDLDARLVQAWEGTSHARWKRVTAWTALLISGVLFMAWAKPAENILGNHDQGMYVAAAFQIQRTGGTAIMNPGLDAIELADRESWLRHDPVQFTRQEREARRYWSLGPGFVLEDQGDKTGVAYPHFPAGYPVFLAALAKSGGWPAVMHGNLALTLMAALLMTGLALRWLGPWAALFLFPLFLFQPLVFWSANHLYAEPLLLLLWLSCLMLIGEADRMPGLAGAALGAGMAAAAAVKIDALGALPLVVVTGIWIRLASRWWAGFLTTLGAGGALIGISMSRSGLYYLMDTSAAIIGGIPLSAWIIPPLLAAVIFLVPSRARLAPGRWLRHPLAARIGAGSVALALIFLYAVRPLGVERDTFYFEPSGDWIPSYREDTLRRLDWYWPWGGVLPLLLAGCVWFVRTQDRTLKLLLLVGGASVVFLAYDLRCNPLQPYAMRRFLPYGVPVLCLSTVAIAHWLGGVRWKLPAALMVTAWSVPVLAGQMMVGAKIQKIAEHKGGFAAVEQLAKDIPETSVVLISTQSPLAALTIPLRCIWGREVYQIHFDKNDRALSERLTQGVRALHAAGREVVVVDSSARFRFNTPFTLAPLATHSWQLELQPGSYTHLDPTVRSTRWRAVVSTLEILPE